MSDFRPFFRSLLVPAASIVLLSLGSAWAAPLFVGITGIETRAGKDSATQIVEFQADLPFQYQMQVLDKDHVVLRLYNARVANGLLTPEGGVNLLTGGSVQSAVLKKQDSKKIAADDYQEIILTGLGLGTRKIQVSGATEFSLARPAKIPAISSVLGSPVAKSPEAKQKGTIAQRAAGLKPPTRGRLSNIHAIPPAVQPDKVVDGRPALAMLAFVGNHKAKNQNQSSQPRIEIAEAGLSKPQIESVTNAPALRPFSSARPEVIAAPGYDAQSSNRPTQPLPERSQLPESPQTAAEAVNDAAPEPGYQVVMPMPRYMGGAAPIKAMTLDSQGKPILIHPKNTPIAEYEVASTNGGYNTLFQAETGEADNAEPTENNKVSQFVADALVDYQSGRYTQAQATLKQALSLDAQNADLYAALAEVQLKLNQPEQASQSYQKASTLAEDKYAQRYAQVLVLSGKRPAAITFLETQYRKNPKQAQLAYMLGTLHEEAGRTTQALSYLKQAAALHPASADIQYNLGLAFELTGDREQAEMHYRKALTLNPGASDIARALARVRG